MTCHMCIHSSRNGRYCKLSGGDALKARARGPWWRRHPCGPQARLFEPIDTSEPAQCRLCKADGRLHDTSTQAGTGYVVGCVHCGNCTDEYATESEAILEWNRG